MKKFLYSVILAFFVLLPVGVLAEGYISVSPSSLTIEQGSSKMFTISAYNAIGDVSIQSSNSGIASVNTSFWETGMVSEKQIKSGSLAVTGVSVGTTTITLTIDGATFDSPPIDLTETITITVNVIAKQASPQTPAPSQNNNNNINNNLSTNNKLKSISVKGYDLIEKDSNNYSLTVSNNITSIFVNATAEDSKAKVTGIGEHKLSVGENNLEVVVTSESGSKNKIIIKVIRKDGYYLEDLNAVLEDASIKEASIIINDESKISSNDISAIKKSRKVVNLNYYGKNKLLLYSWILDGTQIKDTKEFVTAISYFSEYSKKISIKANYAEGLNISFKHGGELPKGTKIRLYVGDKFVEESLVNIYYYNNDKNTLETIKKGIKVTEGYVDFELSHCSDYFVTMSNIAEINKNTDFSIDAFMIISIIELLIIVVLMLVYYLKIKPNTLTEKNIDNLIIDKQE